MNLTGREAATVGYIYSSLGVQTIQNGVDKFAWGIGQGIVRNCRETVCNFISRNVRNVDFGVVPKSAEIPLIHGVWHLAAANPNPAANRPHQARGWRWR